MENQRIKQVKFSLLLFLLLLVAFSYGCAGTRASSSVLQPIEEGIVLTNYQNLEINTEISNGVEMSQVQADRIVKHIISQLKENGFDIVGSYHPANDSDRLVFIITSNDLKTKVDEVGGLRGFAATLRVAITDNNGINLSYTSPLYWGNAYWGTEFDQVEALYTEISTNLETALSNIGESKNLPFGSEDGVSTKSLKKYRYMIGMEKFNNVVELNEFDSFEDAVNTIDKNLEGSENSVYSVEFANSKIKLYGIAVGGEKGEDHFLPIIDITTPKHTAFLPYELLVIDNKAVMLHGRYRIALSFPDLTMMTFSKIMSTPGDIKKAFKEYTK